MVDPQAMHITSANGLYFVLHSILLWETPQFFNFFFLKKKLFSKRWDCDTLFENEVLEEKFGNSSISLLLLVRASLIVIVILATHNTSFFFF
jgi:hypothetical protein